MLDRNDWKDIIDIVQAGGRLKQVIMLNFTAQNILEKTRHED